MILLSGCSVFNNDKDLKEDPMLRVISSSDTYRKDVSFTLQNQSNAEILIESIVYLKIKQYDKEYRQWTEIPYLPCDCGTPCMPPASRKLKKNGSLTVSWNRTEVTCNFEDGKTVPETIRRYRKKGKYKFFFAFYPVVDGRKTGRQILEYEFRLK